MPGAFDPSATKGLKAEHKEFLTIKAKTFFKLLENVDFTNFIHLSILVAFQHLSIWNAQEFKGVQWNVRENSWFKFCGYLKSVSFFSSFSSLILSTWSAGRT